MERILFDHSKLRGRIVEKGLSQKRISEVMGITQQAFSKKMNNTTQFSSSDIVSLTDLLEIEPTDIGAYFFTPLV